MENTIGIRRVVFDDINEFCKDKSLYKALYINMYKLNAKYRSSMYRNELEDLFVPLVNAFVQLDWKHLVSDLLK